MPRSRSWAMASGGVKPRPPARTRSASAPTMASTSTAGEVGDIGQVDGLGRVVAAARRSRRPGRRRRWRTGSRCWPASATRCARGSAGIVDGGALVVGQGRPGRRPPRWAPARLDGRRCGWPRAAGALPARRWRCRRRRRRGARASDDGQRDEASSQVDAVTREPPGGIGPEGRPGHGTPLASGDGSTEGCQVDRCTVLPTFLSKVRASTGGRRPDFRPRGAVTVAGLCRIHTGFATTRR